MTKQGHIEYWLASALSDWESVPLLFDGGKYLQSLFFTHLTLEKISKALFIYFTNEIYPPKTHDILKLLSKINKDIDENVLIFLKAFNVYNLEGRYPDYLSLTYQTTTKEKTFKLIKQAGEVRLCLIEMMQ